MSSSNSKLEIYEECRYLPRMFLFVSCQDPQTRPEMITLLDTFLERSRSSNSSDGAWNSGKGSSHQEIEGDFLLYPVDGCLSTTIVAKGTLFFLWPTCLVLSCSGSKTESMQCSGAKMYSDSVKPRQISEAKRWLESIAEQSKCKALHGYGPPGYNWYSPMELGEKWHLSLVSIGKPGPATVVFFSFSVRLMTRRP